MATALAMAAAVMALSMLARHRAAVVAVALMEDGDMSGGMTQADSNRGSRHVHHCGEGRRCSEKITSTTVAAQ